VRNREAMLAFAAIVWLICRGQATAGGVYTQLAFPGAIYTQATGISGGNVVGYDENSSQIDYGFLYNGTTYTTVGPPGAIDSSANAVSGANVVGDYAANGSAYSFLYNGSTYTQIGLSGAIRTEAMGVSGGNVVGDSFIATDPSRPSCTTVRRTLLSPRPGPQPLKHGVSPVPTWSGIIITTGPCSDSSMTGRATPR